MVDRENTSPRSTVIVQGLFWFPNHLDGSLPGAGKAFLYSPVFDESNIRMTLGNCCGHDEMILLQSVDHEITGGSPKKGVRSGRTPAPHPFFRVSFQNS